MKCLRCQFENPEGMIFCGECGAKIESVCPKCSFSNPLEFKFCGKCGQKLSLPSEAPLKDLTFDEKLKKIQRYLPEGLTEKILSQRDRIEGERKQVTVMFADMEGFTSFSEKLGPEEAYTVMDQVYEILIHKVHDYEGTVNEFTGDGIMALFGAPIALEDAPQRAIRSAYAIHREITKFSEKIKKEKQTIPPIKMRVGIHTGLVVVGTLGNDLRVEFKAVGDTVNLASRIEGLAIPGSTYVSEETFKLTEGLFRFEALGEYTVKGKAESVKAYRVIAPSSSRTRFDVSAERGLTQFVGRDRELEILLDGFERSKTGRGQACSIVSEAGVGKSRLLYEFRKAVSNEDVTFQEGKCLSYSRNVAYHPVIEVVKANFNIVEGDGDSEIREKLKRGLKILDADEAQTLPYLLELLGVKDSGVDAISLSPEARKDRIIKSIIRITIKASQIRPLIAAIEDLHWIDSSSEDYLKELLDSISGARVFLIFTYRPEYIHTWGTKSYHSQVNLNRLSNRESLAMVTHLLGTEDIGNDLEELILEKTEGVPFFIEEFIKSLKDLNAIERKDGTYNLVEDVQAVSIPSTIQDVIMARVDKLPEEAKNLIQTGSVIEREFSYELIRSVSDLPEQEFLSRLSVLKDSELIFERGIYPESTYVFKHALTQEVVYDSILTRKKKELHNKIGKAIEQVYKDNLHEYYRILAEHFISSENFKKGAEYCRLAGKKAEKAGSLNDSTKYGEKQIACLERLPKTEKVEKSLIDARTTLGLYYDQLGQKEKAKTSVEPIIELSIAKNYKKRISHIYNIMGQYYGLVEEDITKAIEYNNEALKIGKELNDLVSLSIANSSMAVYQVFNCEFAEALHYYEKTLEINTAANALWGISAIKSMIAAWVYGMQGTVDLAYETSTEALHIADQSGDIYSKAWANWAHGESCLRKGYLKKAEEHLIKGSDFSERINLSPCAEDAHAQLGATYFYMKDFKKSKMHIKKSISIIRNLNSMPSFIMFLKIYLTMVEAMNKEKDINLNDLLKCVDDNKVKIFEGYMLECIGRILLNMDDQHTLEAEDWIKRAIESNQKYGMRWNLARDYALYAELFKRKADLTKAKEKLSKAIEIFKECGADGWVEKYEKELEALS
jgi:class 3 adenylate cyclase/tetratricopeptide (TPR) repeat protein